MKRELKTLLTYGIATDDLTPREKKHWIFWLYVVFAMLVWNFFKNFKHDIDHTDGNFRHEKDYDMFAESRENVTPIAYQLADNPSPVPGMLDKAYADSKVDDLTPDDINHPTVAEGTTPADYDPPDVIAERHTRDGIVRRAQEDRF